MNPKLTHFSFFLIMLFASCGEYNKILKNTDILLYSENKKMYEDGKRYFNEKKYSQTIVLFEKIMPLMKGTIYMEESLYLLARSYYIQKNYASAAEYFKSYYTSFPKGEHTESARFYSAYSLYLKSPDVHLDQSDTHKAIQQFQDFLKYYPHSEKKEIIRHVLLSELQEKLALKELIATRLYYNLGNYNTSPFPGGNYLSCFITAQNALQSYPSSKYKEDFMYYTFMAKYEMVLQNIKDGRECDITNEYNSYISEFPSGKYLKEIQKLYNDYANKHD